ncbi:MAG: TetR/AcrR family transcriptional regulator [Anaerolineaceae bacterium]
MSTDTPIAILQAAHTLFVKQGYTATAMHEIAEAAGIGKATIYHHFRSKEEILLSLVTSSLDDLHSYLTSIRQVEGPRQRLRVAAALSIGYLYNSSDLIQTARREVPAIREMMVERLIPFFTDFSVILEDTFREGMAIGIFRQIDPSETAAVFITLVQGNFARFYLTRMRFDTPENATEVLLKVFFNGINAVPENPPSAFVK